MVVNEVTFDTDFKEKYRSEEFVYEELSRPEGAWDRFVNWLSEFLGSIFQFENAETAGNVATIVLRSIFGLVVLAVVYFIVRGLLNEEGKWIFGKQASRNIIKYDDLESNLQLVDFEKLIKQSLQAGETRLSIRYYYLWLLKRMADRQIIEWDPEKTNSDYQYEIKGEQLSKDFSYLSYLYNYIWYGEFEIDAVAFEKAKKAFEKTIQSVY